MPILSHDNRVSRHGTLLRWIEGNPVRTSSIFAQTIGSIGRGMAMRQSRHVLSKLVSHSNLIKTLAARVLWRLPLQDVGACQLPKIRVRPKEIAMSKAFIARIIQETTDVNGTTASRAASNLMQAMVKEMKSTGKFTLSSFGTFVVRKTKSRKALNPRTGEAVRVRAGKTVRFKASPVLKKKV
jgi:DNA-binding protein HU-beta